MAKHVNLDKMSYKSSEFQPFVLLHRLEVAKFPQRKRPRSDGSNCAQPPMAKKQRPSDAFLTNLIEKVKTSVTEKKSDSCREKQAKGDNIFENIASELGKDKNPSELVSNILESCEDSEDESSGSSAESHDSNSDSEEDSSEHIDSTLDVPELSQPNPEISVKTEGGDDTIYGHENDVTHDKLTGNSNLYASDGDIKQEAVSPDNLADTQQDDKELCYGEPSPDRIIHIAPVPEYDLLSEYVKEYIPVTIDMPQLECHSERKSTNSGFAGDHHGCATNEPSTSNGYRGDNHSYTVTNETRKKLLNTIIEKRGIRKSDDFDWTDRQCSSVESSLMKNCDGNLNPHSVFETSTPKQKTSVFSSDSLDRYLAECGQLKRPLASQTVQMSSFDDQLPDVDVIDGITIKSFCSHDALKSYAQLPEPRKKSRTSSHKPPLNLSFFSEISSTDMQKLNINLCDINRTTQKQKIVPDKRHLKIKQILPVSPNNEQQPSKGKIYGRRHNGTFASKALLASRKKRQSRKSGKQRGTLAPPVISAALAKKAVSAVRMGSPLRCDQPEGVLVDVEKSDEDDSEYLDIFIGPESEATDNVMHRTQSEQCKTRQQTRLPPSEMYQLFLEVLQQNQFSPRQISGFQSESNQLLFERSSANNLRPWGTNSVKVPQEGTQPINSDLARKQWQPFMQNQPHSTPSEGHPVFDLQAESINTETLLKPFILRLSSPPCKAQLAQMPPSPKNMQSVQNDWQPTHVSFLPSSTDGGLPLESISTKSQSLQVLSQPELIVNSPPANKSQQVQDDAEAPQVCFIPKSASETEPELTTAEWKCIRETSLPARNQGQPCTSPAKQFQSTTLAKSLSRVNEGLGHQTPTCHFGNNSVKVREVMVEMQNEHGDEKFVRAYELLEPLIVATEVGEPNCLSTECPVVDSSFGSRMEVDEHPKIDVQLPHNFYQGKAVLQEETLAVRVKEHISPFGPACAVDDRDIFCNSETLSAVSEGYSLSDWEELDVDLPASSFISERGTGAHGGKSGVTSANDNTITVMHDGMTADDITDAASVIRNFFKAAICHHRGSKVEDFDLINAMRVWQKPNTYVVKVVDSIESGRFVFKKVMSGDIPREAPYHRNYCVKSENDNLKITRKARQNKKKEKNKYCPFCKKCKKDLHRHILEFHDCLPELGDIFNGCEALLKQEITLRKLLNSIGDKTLALEREGKGLGLKRQAPVENCEILQNSNSDIQHPKNLNVQLAESKIIQQENGTNSHQLIYTYVQQTDSQDVRHNEQSESSILRLLESIVNKQLENTVVEQLLSAIVEQRHGRMPKLNGDGDVISAGTINVEKTDDDFVLPTHVQQAEIALAQKEDITRVNVEQAENVFARQLEITYREQSADAFAEQEDMTSVDDTDNSFGPQVGTANVNVKQTADNVAHHVESAAFKQTEIAFAQQADTTSVELRANAFVHLADRAYVQQAEKAFVQQADITNVQQAEKAFVQQADMTNVQQSEKAFVQQADMTNVQQAEKAFVQQADMTNVQQAEKAFVQQADMTNVQQAEKAFVQQADRANVQQADKAFVQQADMTNVQQAEKAFVQQADRANVQQSEKAFVQQADMTNVQQSEKAFVQQADMTNVQQSEKAFVQQADMTNVQQSEKAFVQQVDMTNVQQSEKAFVQQADMTNVQQSEKAFVQQADMTYVQQAEKAYVQLADMTNVQQSEKAFVQQADMTNVQQSEKAFVQQADMTNVQQSEKAFVQQADMTNVQQAEKAFVQQADRANVQQAEKAFVQQAGSTNDQQVQNANMQKFEHPILLQKMIRNVLVAQNLIAQVVEDSYGQSEGNTAIHLVDNLGVPPKGDTAEQLVVDLGVQLEGDTTVELVADSSVQSDENTILQVVVDLGQQSEANTTLQQLQNTEMPENDFVPQQEHSFIQLLEDFIVGQVKSSDAKLAGKTVVLQVDDAVVQRLEEMFSWQPGFSNVQLTENIHIKQLTNTIVELFKDVVITQEDDTIVLKLEDSFVQHFEDMVYKRIGKADSLVAVNSICREMENTSVKASDGIINGKPKHGDENLDAKLKEACLKTRAVVVLEKINVADLEALRRQNVTAVESEVCHTVSGSSPRFETISGNKHFRHGNKANTSIRTQKLALDKYKPRGMRHCVYCYLWFGNLRAHLASVHSREHAVAYALKQPRQKRNHLITKIIKKGMAKFYHELLEKCPSDLNMIKQQRLGNSFVCCENCHELFTCRSFTEHRLQCNVRAQFDETSTPDKPTDKEAQLVEDINMNYLPYPDANCNRGDNIKHQETLNGVNGESSLQNLLVSQSLTQTQLCYDKGCQGNEIGRQNQVTIKDIEETGSQDVTESNKTQVVERRVDQGTLFAAANSLADDGDEFSGDGGNDRSATVEDVSLCSSSLCSVQAQSSSCHTESSNGQTQSFTDQSTFNTAYTHKQGRSFSHGARYVKHCISCSAELSYPSFRRHEKYGIKRHSVVRDLTLKELLVIKDCLSQSTEAARKSTEQQCPFCSVKSQRLSKHLLEMHSNVGFVQTFSSLNVGSQNKVKNVNLQKSSPSNQSLARVLCKSCFDRRSSLDGVLKSNQIPTSNHNKLDVTATGLSEEATTTDGCKKIEAALTPSIQVDQLDNDGLTGHLTNPAKHKVLDSVGVQSSLVGSVVNKSRQSLHGRERVKDASDIHSSKSRCKRPLGLVKCNQRKISKLGKSDVAVKTYADKATTTHESKKIGGDLTNPDYKSDCLAVQIRQDTPVLVESPKLLCKTEQVKDANDGEREQVIVRCSKSRCKGRHGVDVIMHHTRSCYENNSQMCTASSNDFDSRVNDRARWTKEKTRLIRKTFKKWINLPSPCSRLPSKKEVLEFLEKEDLGMAYEKVSKLLYFTEGCRFGCICHLCGDSNNTEETKITSPLHVDTPSTSTPATFSPSYKLLSPCHDPSPPLPNVAGSPPCKNVHCRMGCVCASIAGSGEEKVKHCGRPECMLRPCDCQRVTRSVSQSARQLWPAEPELSGRDSENECGRSSEPTAGLLKKNGKDSITRRSKRVAEKTNFRTLASLKALWCYDASQWAMKPKRKAKPAQASRQVQPNKHMKQRSIRFKKLFKQAQCLIKKKTGAEVEKCARSTVRQHDWKGKQVLEHCYHLPKPPSIRAIASRTSPQPPAMEDQNTIDMSKFRVQMVLLKTLGAGNSPLLVELLSNCQWEKLHGQMLKLMTGLLEMKPYPSSYVIRYEHFRVEVLHRTGHDILLPEHIQKKLGRETARPALRLMVTPFTASDELMLTQRMQERSGIVVEEGLKRALGVKGDEAKVAARQLNQRGCGLSGLGQFKVTVPGYKGGGTVSVPQSADVNVDEVTVDDAVLPASTLKEVKIRPVARILTEKHKLLKYKPQIVSVSREQDTAGVEEDEEEVSISLRPHAESLSDCVNIDHGCLCRDPKTAPPGTFDPIVIVDDVDNDDDVDVDMLPSMLDGRELSPDMSRLKPLTDDSSLRSIGEITRLTISAAEDGKMLVNQRCMDEEKNEASANVVQLYDSCLDTNAGAKHVDDSMFISEDLMLLSNSNVMKEPSSNPDEVSPLLQGSFSANSLNVQNSEALDDQFSLLKFMLNPADDVDVTGSDAEVDITDSIYMLTDAERLRYQMTGVAPSRVKRDAGVSLSCDKRGAGVSPSRDKRGDGVSPSRDAPTNATAVDKSYHYKTKSTAKSRKKNYYRVPATVSDPPRKIQFLEGILNTEADSNAKGDNSITPDVVQYSWESEARPKWTQSVLKMSRERHRRHDISCRFKQLYKTCVGKDSDKNIPVKHIILSLGLKRIVQERLRLAKAIEEYTQCLEINTRFKNHILYLQGHPQMKLPAEKIKTMRSLDREFVITRGNSTGEKSSKSHSSSSKAHNTAKNRPITQPVTPAIPTPAAPQSVSSTKTQPSKNQRSQQIMATSASKSRSKAAKSHKEGKKGRRVNKSPAARPVRVRTPEFIPAPVKEEPLDKEVKQEPGSGGHDPGVKVEEVSQKRVIKYVADNGVTYSIVIQHNNNDNASSGDASSSAEDN